MSGIAPEAAQSAANRISDIRTRGTLNCGIWPEVSGFAMKRGDTYAGFDTDICRAVAAAIFGDASKVRFTTLAHISDFNQHSDIDLVARRLTWTMPRETAGAIFGPVTFYDGQGFLVPRVSGIRRISQITDRICVINLERHPRTLFNYLKDNRQDVPIVLVDDDQAAEQALQQQRCSAYSADISWLAAARASFADGIARFDILPEIISKEPLAPLLHGNDAEFVRLVQWTLFAMIDAEELGVTSQNIEAAKSVSSAVRRFMNVHPGSNVVPAAGVWTRAIISSVGNYGEMFERNLGTGSNIGLDRGLNRLWRDGGLMYSPPLDR